MNEALDHGCSAALVASFDEQAALVALLRHSKGQSWVELAAAVLDHGSADSAYRQLTSDSLFDGGSLDVALKEAAVDVRKWADEGLQFWTILDDRYPARVRDIHQAPPFLFARGERFSGSAVSVVGSRDASDWGLAAATSIAKSLVEMDLTVIAGLASGIDTAAHLAALRCGGRTVAVIGTGIRRSYPRANRELQEAIASRGLLLSQFWPDAPPQPQNFPMRNAIMSGYGIATVVVEAGETSGTRIQARLAVQHGRPVILTETVVRQTKWGKALLSRPDVFVAESTEDVKQIVQDLINRPLALDEAFRSVAV